MQRPIKRPISTRVERGRTIAHVTLASGQVCRILAVDQARLAELGVTPNWTLNDNGNGRGYVCGHSKKVFSPRSHGLVRIARIVAGAVSGQIVRYEDNDPLNLLPENLVVDRGHSDGREAAVFK
jgi:hypothetical protein